MIKKKVAFLLLYSCIISVLTLIVDGLIFNRGYFPAVLMTENAIYDLFQKAHVIDRNSDTRYQRYADELTQLFCINIDSAYLDKQSGRVKKDSLSLLLEKLALIESTYQFIFLDYWFLKPEETQDTEEENARLATRMKALDDHLILPYLVNNQSQYIYQDVKAEDWQLTKEEERLYYSSPHRGFLAFSGLQLDQRYRYHQLQVAEGEQHSAVYEMLKMAPPVYQSLKDTVYPKLIEINYLLRNQNDGNAIRILEASQLVKEWPTEYLAQETKDKKIIIGVFDTYKDFNGNLVDQHPTPIKENFNGIYIILNTYLNVLTASFIKRSSWQVVFFVNLLLASLGLLYYRFCRPFVLEAVWPSIIVLIVTSILSLYLLYVFFNLGHFKFPFIITVLGILRYQKLLHNYLKSSSIKRL